MRRSLLEQYMDIIQAIHYKRTFTVKGASITEIFTTGNVSWVIANRLLKRLIELGLVESSRPRSFLRYSLTAKGFEAMTNYSALQEMGIAERTTCLKIRMGIYKEEIAVKTG